MTGRSVKPPPLTTSPPSCSRTGNPARCRRVTSTYLSPYSSVRGQCSAAGKRYYDRPLVTSYSRCITFIPDQGVVRRVQCRRDREPKSSSPGNRGGISARGPCSNAGAVRLGDVEVSRQRRQRPRPRAFGDSPRRFTGGCHPQVREGCDTVVCCIGDIDGPVSQEGDPLRNPKPEANVTCSSATTAGALGRRAPQLSVIQKQEERQDKRAR